METKENEGAAVNTAPIKWAQRSDCLFLTVDLHGISDDSVTFTETTMQFSGMSEEKYFEAHVEFYKPIVANRCQWKNHPLGVEIYVKKKDAEFWPHLLKDKSLEKLNTVTTDWNHYVDSEEEDEKETGFDWAKMI
jgi:hypothetical protein